MTKYTSYQDRYFAEQLLLKRPQSSYDSLASAMSGVKVDLNPHQVDAALFAMQSPLSSGVLMADEVGLGKTIEAGLVLAQYWAERKRNILLIVPAALRTQWRSELSEKFYIDSLILESSNFNKMRKEGCLNPFDAKNQVVICSYNFAANKDSFVHAMPWDLVVLDEAHRLRNVYKPQNVTANKLKNALKGRKKLLLTATPLQNNLMELYGLVSFIDEHKMQSARQSILENFDEVVAARLKDCQDNTIASLDKFTQWIYYFFMIHGAERVKPLEQWRLRFHDNGVERTYNLKWKDAEESGDVFLRREDPLYESWLKEAMAVSLPPATLRFDHSHSERNISFLNTHPHLKGVLSIDKLSYTAISDEEHLVFSAITDDGTNLDDETINAMLELPAEVIGDCPTDFAALNQLRQQGLAQRQRLAEENNKQYYLAECDKLDAYSEDLKEGLQHDLKDLKKLIEEKKKAFRASTSLPLAEMLDMKDEINKLEVKYKKMRRNLCVREDEIDEEKERLQDEVRQKLQDRCTTGHIMTIGFEIV